MARNGLNGSIPSPFLRNMMKTWKFRPNMAQTFCIRDSHLLFYDSYWRKLTISDSFTVKSLGLNNLYSAKINKDGVELRNSKRIW